MSRTDLAGKTVTLKNDIHDPYNGHIPAGTEYRVEGYWDDITGGSWMYADGNPACLNYAIRSVSANLPLDDNVLYGKIGAFGFLIHTTEVEE